MLNYGLILLFESSEQLQVLVWHDFSTFKCLNFKISSSGKHFGSVFWIKVFTLPKILMKHFVLYGTVCFSTIKFQLNARNFHISLLPLKCTNYLIHFHWKKTFIQVQGCFSILICTHLLRHLRLGHKVWKKMPPKFSLKGGGRTFIWFL